MAETGIEQSWATVFGDQRGDACWGQVIDIVGDAVGHLPLCGMAPAVIDHVQFGRRRWQALHMDARAIAVPQQTCRFAVPTEAIPAQEQRALAMPAALLDEGKDSVAGEMVCGDREGEAQALLLGGDGDRPAYGEAIVAVPTLRNWGLPLGCPSPAHCRLEHAAGLSNDDNGAALTLGFF
jgi:hypothetical protein